MRCIRCNTEVVEEAKFCPKCGAPMAASQPKEESCYCSECGAPLHSSDKFCEQCGTSLKKKASIVDAVDNAIGGMVDKGQQTLGNISKSNNWNPLVTIVIIGVMATNLVYLTKFISRYGYCIEYWPLWWWIVMVGYIVCIFACIMLLGRRKSGCYLYVISCIVSCLAVSAKGTLSFSGEFSLAIITCAAIFGILQIRNDSGNKAWDTLI